MGELIFFLSYVSALCEVSCILKFWLYFGYLGKANTLAVYFDWLLQEQVENGKVTPRSRS